MKTCSLVLACLTLFAYLSVGAILFRVLEGQHEIGRQQEILNRTRWLLENKTCLTQKDLLRLLDFVGQDNDLARFVLSHNDATDTVTDRNLTNIKWDGPGACSFVLSVITTIGYGHITPKTPLGRSVCMVYALLGIPLMLLVLAGTGERLCRICTKCVYIRGRRSGSALLCKARRRVHIFLQGVIGLVILFVLPTTANVLLEGWTVLDAVYFSLITFTTIGFGDLVACNPVDRDKYEENVWVFLYRYVSLVWTLIGLAYVSMLVTTIMQCYMRSTGKLDEKIQQRLMCLCRRVRHKLKCRENGQQPSADDKVLFTVPVKFLTENDEIPESLVNSLTVELVRFSVIHDEQPTDTGST